MPPDRSVTWGAGTVKFIVPAAAPDEFFFMEMNTRLQVEHPVTEMVTGVDMVNWQVRIADGEPLTLRQEDITPHSLCDRGAGLRRGPRPRILPTGGTILARFEPSRIGIGVDSGLRVGIVVGSDDDPILAKVIAHGDTRREAIAWLDRRWPTLTFWASAPTSTSAASCWGNLGAQRRPGHRALGAHPGQHAPPTPSPGAHVAVAMASTAERWRAVPADRRGRGTSRTAGGSAVVTRC
ncbi:MAG: hypothetical protein ACK5MT_03170 [Actinomycetales bacterium]